MIDKREIRVNNWFILDSEHFQVTESEITSDHFWLISDRLAPIHLSPEVLEKCGFESPAVIKDVSDLFFLTTDSKIGFRLQLEKNHEDGYYVCEWLPLFHIEFLHQLQTLYFSLTGTELNYTP